ncbi:MAG: DUF3786 domain-containing protein [Firmicutes bacterium]|nr:DUF3786 domain-containing protein [Bacillota bacterium]
MYNLQPKKHYEAALLAIKKEFSSKDPQLMAECSGAVWHDGILKVIYCGQPVSVSYPDGQVSLQEDLLSHEEEIVILQYLTWAKGLPPRGRWLSFRELKGGYNHWVPFQKEILFPLASAYHGRAEEFKRQILRSKGELVEQGDAGGIVYVLPKMPLYYLLWNGSADQPPRSSILFDQVAETYLPTASLYVMAIEATKKNFFTGDRGKK